MKTNNPKTRRCVAVIPARGGSKRVPGKNVRKMLGQPLIAYTIQAAIDSQVFDRVIVSTDSEQIAEQSLRFGAEVPFLRRSEIADDYTPVSVVTADALDQIDSDRSRYDAVAQMMANCPLRTAQDVRDSYSQFCETGAQSQISVTQYGWQNPWWAMRCSSSKTLSPLFDAQVTARSQDLPELFCPTGAIWWAKAPALAKHLTFHLPERKGWSMPWRRAVDIDTEDDWQMAELLMRLSIERSKVHAV